jgi:tetratricopeptide (TPR) repeat protein
VGAGKAKRETALAARRGLKENAKPEANDVKKVMEVENQETQSEEKRDDSDVAIVDKKLHKDLVENMLDVVEATMRVNDAPMAEECSREAIALSPATPDYLLAHGAILASRGNLEEAEVFLKSALDATPNAVDAWLVVALLYHLMERGRDKRTALKAAKALCDEDLTGAYLALARKLLPINCAVLIELALQHEEQLSGGVTGALLLTRGEMQLHSASAAVAAMARLVQRFVLNSMVFHLMVR